MGLFGHKKKREEEERLERIREEQIEQARIHKEEEEKDGRSLSSNMMYREKSYATNYLTIRILTRGHRMENRN